MAEESRFKCLRCGYEFTASWGRDEERTCPRCRSNSVRRLRRSASRREPRTIG